MTQDKTATLKVGLKMEKNQTSDQGWRAARLEQNEGEKHAVHDGIREAKVRRQLVIADPGFHDVVLSEVSVIRRQSSDGQ